MRTDREMEMDKGILLDSRMDMVNGMETGMVKETEIRIINGTEMELEMVNGTEMEMEMGIINGTEMEMEMVNGTEMEMGIINGTEMEMGIAALEIIL